MTVGNLLGKFCVSTKYGSPGRTRTYNPPVNSLGSHDTEQMLQSVTGR